MNKLIQNTVFIFFMLFECLAMAQSSVEAKAILDKVTTTVNSFENIQIEFSYEFG